MVRIISSPHRDIGPVRSLSPVRLAFDDDGDLVARREFFENFFARVCSQPPPSMAAAFAATSMVPAYNPATGTTTSGVPKRSSSSDNIWLTTMRARPGSKRNVKIEKHENISPRASARDGKAAKQSNSFPNHCSDDADVGYGAHSGASR
jgi:hypothetical protein